MDHHMAHVDNVHQYETVLSNRLDSGGTLRGANGQILQFVAVSRNGQHEYIDNSMLTAEFIAIQLENGLSVNFATTDQTIQAAQQNQQQLLAQTTVIDEQYVIQHEIEEPGEELISEQPPAHIEAALPFETEVIVPNRNVQQKVSQLPSLTPIPRAKSTGKASATKTTNMQPTVNLTVIKSELIINDSEDDEANAKKRRSANIKRPAAAASKNTKELPHKKRITSEVPPPVKSRALNNGITSNAQTNTAKKPAAKVVASVKHVPNVPKVEVNALACEICSLVMDTQLDFFRHLKLHYEPVTLVKPKQEPKVADIPVPVAITKSDRSTRLRKPSQRAAESSKTLSRSSKKAIVLEPEPPKSSKKQSKTISPKPRSVQELLEQFPDNEQLDDEEEDVDDDEVTGGGVDDTNDSDYAPANEFSDSEDMLEGIRGTVDKVVDTKHDWLDGELTEEIMFSNADIEGNTDDDDDEQDLKKDIKIESRSESGDEDETAKPNAKKRVKRQIPDASKLDFTEFRDMTRGKSGKGKRCFRCNVCEKVCMSMNSLQYHFLSHTGERPYQCQDCGKGFMANSALKVHMRLHTGQKPHICEICSRAFRQWGDLKYHITSLHTDEKNHQCEYCGKEFARRYSLVIHRRIHTGERNYKCEYCNKSFRASTYLQDHRRIHTGEKPHNCDYCDKKFRVRGDLKRHWNIHLRSALPLGKMSEFDEVAAAIQIIDDGKGGFTVKNEEENIVQTIAAPTPPKTQDGFKPVDPIELAKLMPVPRKVKQQKYPRVRRPGDE